MGEIEQPVATEHVVHLSDLICRRSIIASLSAAKPEALRELANIGGGVLGWDEAHKRQKLEYRLQPEPFSEQPEGWTPTLASPTPVGYLPRHHESCWHWH